MMRIVWALLVLVSWAGKVNAQDIILKGKINDKDDSKPIVGATVRAMLGQDSANAQMVVTDSKGRFEIKSLTAGNYTITITSSSYEKITQKINLQASNKEPIPFTLTKLSKLLGEVTITSRTPPVKQKGDTVEFSASQFKVNPDATAEDMIRKLPGITVDRNGNVTSGGDQVRKVTVDGRDFFGDDATAALRNLPAEVIDKIQVFDRLSDQAAFTGFDDGSSTKSINIVTKGGIRNGQFGRIYAGAGTEGRYQAGGNVSLFKNNRRLSIVGLSNNINQQNFATQDLLGVTSSSTGGNRGGGRGGPRGGGGGNNFGGGNNGGNFLVGQQNGISKTNAIGLNYSDTWGKKTEVSGSYFFNNNNNSNDQQSNSTYFLTTGRNQLYDEMTLSRSNNYNHRLNLRIEYKIDSFNSISITPSLSFQKNLSLTNIQGYNSYSDAEAISRSINSTDNSSNGYNIGNNILYRHAFRKRGRTVSLNLNTSLNKRTGDIYLNNANQYFRTGNNLSDSLQQYTDQLSNGYQLSANVAYTEPMGKDGQLQFNYTPSYTKSKSDQEAYRYDYINAKYSIFDNNLSNKFDNTVMRQSTGISFRKGNRDNMFSIGLSYQYTELNSTQEFPLAAKVKKSFNNLLPNLMWTKKINAKNSIRLFYRSNTNAPSVNQLQNVINNNNPLFISSGNPDLKQQFSHTLSSRYTFTNTSKGKSFFANLFLQQNANYIGNATYIASADSVLNSTVTLFKGSQLSKPVNLDGYWSLRSFFTYAFPVKFIKSNLSVNAGLTYAKVPGLINNVLNKSNSYNYNAGLVVASNISEYIDFNVSYAANFNVVKNSIQPQLNNNYISQTAGVQLNMLNKKGWFVQNDLNNQSFSGLTDGFNQNYWLWNASVGKKFLKNQAGELKLSVFDLLKQNQSIVRTVTETYVEDVQNQVLQQYFMLTFTYKLKNFGVAKQAAPRAEGGFRERGAGGFGGF
jgi:Outer membrane protein beta-barrel family/Carboxypeptidase regulatory-like domain